MGQMFTDEDVHLFTFDQGPQNFSYGYIILFQASKSQFYKLQVSD